MRSLLTIVIALSGLAAAGLPKSSGLPQSPPQPLSYTPMFAYRHPTGSRSVEPSTATATHSESHPLAQIVHRRASNATAPPTITDIVPSSNNVAAASEFNLYFSMMDLNSECNLETNTQATVCINEQIATCGRDGKYKLQACPSGQKCWAVPLDAGRKGLSIQCVPKDGANMAQLNSRSNAPTLASVMKNSTLVGREPSSSTITNIKTTAPALGGNKMTNITMTTLYPSAKTRQVVNPSHASSIAKYSSATVPTPTTAAAETKPKSETSVLRIIPMTRGRNPSL